MRIMNYGNRLNFIFTAVRLLQKLLIVYFVTGLTFSGNVFHFFRHLTDFIEHFYPHHKHDGPICLIDFIILHSKDGAHQSSNNHDNSSHPFHHHHPGDCYQSLTFPFLNSPLAIQFHLPSTGQRKMITHQLVHSSEFYSSIWQPPKMS